MFRQCLGDPLTGASCSELVQRGRCPAHQRIKENARPGRDIYRGGWPRHSRERRAEEDRCIVCGTDRDLTVDHPTDDVICRRHHGVREAQRRANRTTSMQSRR